MLKNSLDRDHKIVWFTLFYYHKYELVGLKV